MDTDQARRLVTLHDNADRAIANLRNANAMATDDPRSTELLEEAGDAYADTLAALFAEQVPLRTAHSAGTAIPTTPPLEAPPVTAPEGFEPGKAAWIMNRDADGDDIGCGVIVPPVEGVADGNVALRLATDAKFCGEDFPRGATISVPTAALTLTQPEGAPSVDVAATNGAREGEGAKTA